MNTPENEKVNQTEENNIIPACEGSDAEGGEVVCEIKEAECAGGEILETPTEDDAGKASKEAYADTPEETQKDMREGTPEEKQEESAGVLEEADETPSETDSEDTQEKGKGKKRLKALWISLSVIALFAIAAAVYFFVFAIDKPFESATLEAGEVPEKEMFFEGEVPEKAVFSPELSELVTSIPGEYEIDVTIGRKTFKSILAVKDTVAPALTVREKVRVWTTVLPEPSEFIAEVADKTEVKLEWAEAPSLSLEGEYTGKIAATDLGGNKTEVDVTFSLVFDTEAPFFDGINDNIEAFIGNTKPNYMEGVVAHDYKTENVIIEVDDSAVDTTAEGKYTVIYRAYDLAGNMAEKTATVTVVKDTDTPVIAGAVNCNIIPGTEFDALSYIKVTDNWDKNVKIEITENIDCNTYGQYPVEVRASDFSGNVSEAKFTVSVGVDTVAPVIVPTDIWVYAGDTVSYRKSVKVTDNFYGTPKLAIDSSGVNLGVIGNYTVKYTATDASGNSAYAEAPVYVIRRPSTEELVSDLADKVLASITNDGMTTLEKIYEVYKWVNKNVRYVGTSDKSSYIAGAYEGLSTGRGDCYTYYAVARVFLDKLGVQNIEMKRTGTRDRHFWNLVNIGNGWYHYDCSFFNTGNGHLFMVTDEEAHAWDNVHFRGEHIFDPSPDCPERATESMQYVVDYAAKKIVQEVQTEISPEESAQ